MYTKNIFLTGKNLEDFLNKVVTGTWVLNPYMKKGTINVNGDVDMSNMNLEYIPCNFYVVTGNFNCSNNKLQDLQGSPLTVRNFNCSNNQLKSLEGAPSKVNGNFDCSKNLLTNLQHAPDNINNGLFNCDDNQLENTQHNTIVTNGGFTCNKQKKERSKK